MTEEEKNKIKVLLKEFFEKEKLIGIYRQSITDFENQISSIEKSIQDLSCVDFAEVDIRSPNFEQSISSSNKASYFENFTINKITEKENLIEKLKEKIESYVTEIQKIQMENALMHNVINLFNEELREIIIARYKEKKSYVEICFELCISKKKYYADENRILESVHNLLVMNTF